MVAPHAATAQMTASPLVPHASDPPRRQRADHRAERRRRVHQPHRRRAAVEHLGREHREQRARHPEDHGDEVDDERRDEDALPAEEAEALLHGLPARRRLLAVVGSLRTERRQRDRGPDRRDERRDVDARTRSRARSACWPARAMMNPAAAGPTTSVALYITWLRARAAGRRSRATTVGTTADRVGKLTAKNAVCTATTTYRYQTGGLPWIAPTSSSTLVAASPNSVIRISHRRSKRSAQVPPQIEKNARGRTWTSPMSPSASVELRQQVDLDRDCDGRDLPAGQRDQLAERQEAEARATPAAARRRWPRGGTPPRRARTGRRRGPRCRPRPPVRDPPRGRP